MYSIILADTASTVVGSVGDLIRLLNWEIQHVIGMTDPELLRVCRPSHLFCLLIEAVYRGMAAVTFKQLFGFTGKRSV